MSSIGILSMMLFCFFISLWPAVVGERSVMLFQTIPKMDKTTDIKKETFITAQGKRQGDHCQRAK